MSKRREFSKSVRVEIIKRATVGNQTICESCRVACRKWEIDHKIAEALIVDKSKRLTAEDGELLCAGSPESCHGRKTALSDVPAIARAVRIEAKSVGASRPKGSIPTAPKQAREQRPLAHGVPEIARRYV